MDIIDSYAIINKSVLEVMRAVNRLEEVPTQKKKEYIRLQENPFTLSKETERDSQIVTAHDLNQYKVRFHSIRLENKVESWLQILLSIREEL